MIEHGLWPADVSPLRLAYPLLAIGVFVVVARWKTSRVTGRPLTFRA